MAHNRCSCAVLVVAEDRSLPHPRGFGSLLVPVPGRWKLKSMGIGKEEMHQADKAIRGMLSSTGAFGSK